MGRVVAYLVVETLVEIVAILEVDLADLGLIWFVFGELQVMVRMFSSGCIPDMRETSFRKATSSLLMSARSFSILTLSLVSCSVDCRRKCVD